MQNNFTEMDLKQANMNVKIVVQFKFFNIYPCSHDSEVWFQWLCEPKILPFFYAACMFEHTKMISSMTENTVFLWNKEPPIPPIYADHNPAPPLPGHQGMCCPPPLTTQPALMFRGQVIPSNLSWGM